MARMKKPEYINGNVAREIDFGKFSIFLVHKKEVLRENGMDSYEPEGKGIGRLRIMKWDHQW